MDLQPILASWGHVLTGYTPALSIEITRECPLHCPGCYAYGDDHLGGGDHAAGGPRSQRPGARGWRPRARRSPSPDSSVDRRRRAARALPRAEHPAAAACPNAGFTCRSSRAPCARLPLEWRHLPRLTLVGLDRRPTAGTRRRRTPATYERILKHIAGHQINVHCTITRQQVNRPGYIDEFLEFWSARPEVRKIWYQPLHAADRRESPRNASGPPTGSASSTICMPCGSAIPKLEVPKGCSTCSPSRRNRRTNASSRA